MREAHEKGSPVMRTLFYEFPDDARCWETEVQYMYGDKYLCCPILEAKTTTLTVYLPKFGGGGKWKSFWDDQSWDGGTEIEIQCTLAEMPIFVKS